MRLIALTVGLIVLVATFGTPVQHTLNPSVESPSNKPLRTEEQEVLYREAIHRTKKHFADLGIDVSIGEPRFAEDEKSMIVIFDVYPSDGEKHTVSVRFERHDNKWRFITVGVLCCGDH